MFQQVSLGMHQDRSRAVRMGEQESSTALDTDPDTSTVTVPRIIAAYRAGKLMNRKTGHS